MVHFRSIQSHLQRISITNCFDEKTFARMQGQSQNNFPNSTHSIWRAKHDGGAFQKDSRAFAKDQQHQHIQFGEQSKMEPFQCNNSRALAKPTTIFNL
jgi:hypothetical protein